MKNRSKATILNVNDHEPNRFAISLELKRAGFKVIEAGSGEEALACLRTSGNSIDLVLLDVQMPGMGGLETCRQIKADPRTLSLPVVQISATYIELEDRVRGLENGADAYLLQSAAPAELVATVRAFVRARRAEQALAFRERELTVLLDNVPGMITRVDPSLRHLFVNAAVERELGRAADTILGKTHRELGLAPHACELWEETTRAVFRTGQAASFEFAYPTSAATRYFEVRLAPEFGVGGAVETVLGVTTDVTERRRAEEERLQATRLLRVVTEASPDLIYAKDPAGRWLFANPAMLHAIGKPAEEVIGRTEAEWHRDPAQASAIRVNDLQMMSAGQPLVVEEPFTTTQGLRLYLSHKAPLVDETGTVIGLVGVSTDITERKQAEEALRLADRRKDEFLATLAHELRNPLAPVLAATRLLQIQGSQEPALVRLRAVIERQVDHLARMLDDLLDMARITQGRIELRKGPLAVDELAREAFHTATLSEHADRQLSLHLPAEPLWVLGDATRLVQVLSNLLNNALKYTPPDGAISLSLEREGDCAVFRVQDTGQGLAPEFAPHVFDLFVQGSRTLDRSQGGLGIGLALVRGLVSLHGGSVEAESPGSGLGSIFTVRLPLTKRLPPAPKPRDGSSGPERLARRVLVVDDNVDAADTVMDLVRLWGHDVQTAYSGEEALEIARRFRPDVVVLDISLPGLNGYEVARLLRAAEGGESLKLIAATGYGRAEDQRVAREAGFDHHLTKPVSLDDLRRIIGG